MHGFRMVKQKKISFFVGAGSSFIICLKRNADRSVNSKNGVFYKYFIASSCMSRAIFHLTLRHRRVLGGVLRGGDTSGFMPARYEGSCKLSFKGECALTKSKCIFTRLKNKEVINSSVVRMLRDSFLLYVSLVQYKF